MPITGTVEVDTNRRIRRPEAVVAAWACYLVGSEAFQSLKSNAHMAPRAFALDVSKAIVIGSWLNVPVGYHCLW